MHGSISVFIYSKFMIMKTLRYILLGILLITIIPFCNSQTTVKEQASHYIAKCTCKCFK